MSQKFGFFSKSRVNLLTNILARAHHILDISSKGQVTLGQVTKGQVTKMEAFVNKQVQKMME